jgi:hypothetical protein
MFVFFRNLSYVLDLTNLNNIDLLNEWIYKEHGLLMERI